MAPFLCGFRVKAVTGGPSGKHTALRSSGTRVCDYRYTEEVMKR